MSSPDTAPPADTVNVQIDGVWMPVPRGTRVIEACRLAGREVPHYCYHPKLSSPGNCRMCLVETGMPPRTPPGQNPPLDEHGYPQILWIPRPAIACANTVADGMGIRTQGPLVEECRNGVMEFLLLNHPLDCPICDQAGECVLQEYSVEHGRGGSRFLDQKVKKPKNVAVGPRIRLDDERCILCSRCIRFCQEIVDDDVLGFTGRGSHTVLTVWPGKKLENNYSLNTVDICPVGALTSNDFRFQMRVWFLKETPSICTSCGRGCNALLASREDQLLRLTPRENNEVNSTWMCDYGRLNFHYLTSPARLLEPLVRGDHGHAAVTWTEALAAAADGLRRAAPGRIAVIGSGRMTNEELFLLRGLARLLEAAYLDIVPRPQEGDAWLVAPDGNPNTVGARHILPGLENPGSRLPAIRDALRNGSIEALLIWGEDLCEAGFTPDELSSARCIVSSHLLANPTADASHVVLPGSGFAEKRGSMINLTGRLQRLNQAVSAPGEARDDWEILRDLTAALSSAEPALFIEDVFRAMAAEIPLFAGLSLSRIGDAGLPLVETGASIPLLERERERIARGEIVG